MTDMPGNDYLDALTKAIWEDRARLNGLLPTGYAFAQDYHTGGYSAQTADASEWEVWATPCWEITTEEVERERAAGYFTVAVQVMAADGRCIDSLTVDERMPISGDIAQDVNAYFKLLLAAVGRARAEAKGEAKAAPQSEDPWIVGTVGHYVGEKWFIRVSEVDAALAALPLDSGCGIDCQKVLDAADVFMDLCADIDHARIAEIAIDQCRIFLHG